MKITSVKTLFAAFALTAVFAGNAFAIDPTTAERKSETLAAAVFTNDYASASSVLSSAVTKEQFALLSESLSDAFGKFKSLKAESSVIDGNNTKATYSCEFEKNKKAKLVVIYGSDDKVSSFRFIPIEG
jgi:hypothetical protein